MNIELMVHLGHKKYKMKDIFNDFSLAQGILSTFSDAHENAPIRKIVPKGKKENAPIFQNSKK